MCREETEHRPRLQPFLVDDLVKQCTRIGKQAAGGRTDGHVAQNTRELAVKFPCVEERHPVDVVAQYIKTDVLDNARSGE